MKISRLSIVLLLALIVGTSSSFNTCKEYIEALSRSIFQQDYAALPLPTIMYSGITTNNPGQMYQCEHKTALGDPYHYFLVGFKNATNNVQTFTGICVPTKCQKVDVEAALHLLKIKYSVVYDYKDDDIDSLAIACSVIFGLWVTVLTIWSIVISCKEPVQNEFIKKDEEIKQPLREEPVNSLVESQGQVKEDYKLFNFYEGYCRVFKRSNQKPILGSILFLATLSILFSTEFSYRQTIAANEIKSLKWFDSFGGVLFCNTEIAFSVIVFILGTKLAYSLFKLNSFHEIGRYFFDQLLIKWLVLVLTSMAAYVYLSLTDQPLNQLWKSKYGADCPSVMYQIWFVFRNLQFDCKVCLQWFWIMEVDILLTILAAPLFIVYRTKRVLGYAIFTLAAVISIIGAYAILDSQNILFEPYKLFNMAKEYTINYQTNTVVRIMPYALGFMLGLFVNQRTEKSENGQKEEELGFVKLVRRNQNVQIAMHFLGFAVMLLTYLLIIPYLSLVEPGETRPQAYAYLIFSPFGFLLGLAIFFLPCLLQGQSKLTVMLTRFFGARLWTSLQKMSIGFLLIGPVVMGFTTYSMQNSIYFDFETVFVYFLGDSVIIYILTLLAVSSIDNQLHSISKFMQAKLFGNESKYSVLVIED